MPKAYPYFRWYPADADTDQKFRVMDDADLGFYLRCLNHAWLNGGIPADPIERARALKTPLKRANKRWERVGQCFTNSREQNAMLINPRQESEREYAVQKSQLASESAKVRYERSANAVPRTYDSVSTSAPASVFSSEGVSKGKPELVPPRPYATDDRFMNFMGEVAMATSLIEADYSDAYTEWLLLDITSRIKAFQNFHDKRIVGAFSDPDKVMRPWRWLKRGEYNRAVPAPQKKPPNLVERTNQLVRQRIARGESPL